ncbi:MAG: DUF3000 domain-containing protein [Frankia sp.]
MSEPLAPQDEAPDVFRSSVAALRAGLGRVRPDIAIHEMAAPRRLAPHALAIAGSVERGGDEIAVGRLVLLIDPAGQPAWEGTARFVCYARATLEPEMAIDPLLSEVAWSWLGSALDDHQAAHRALGGTVTSTTSRRFGLLGADGDSFDVEMRCSWSPDWAETARRGRRAWTPGGTTAHLHAFGDLLASMAGLPPRLPGVVPLPITHI